MLKLTALALSLLTVATIGPQSPATAANVRPLSLQQPAGNLHSQIILKVGGKPRYRARVVSTRRQIELKRARAAARRMELKRAREAARYRYRR